MSKILTLSLSPEDAAFDESINKFIKNKLNSNTIEPCNWKILKKSIDARKRKVKILLRIEIIENEEISKKPEGKCHYLSPSLISSNFTPYWIWI